MSTNKILIIGFTHGCVSTIAREAIMANLDVLIDPDGIGACDINHELLGFLPADEVRRSSLLQLAHMGAIISSLNNG